MLNSSCFPGALYWELSINHWAKRPLVGRRTNTWITIHEVETVGQLAKPCGSHQWLKWCNFPQIDNTFAPAGSTGPTLACRLDVGFTFWVFFSVFIPALHLNKAAVSACAPQRNFLTPTCSLFIFGRWAAASVPSDRTSLRASARRRCPASFDQKLGWTQTCYPKRSSSIEQLRNCISRNMFAVRRSSSNRGHWRKRFSSCCCGVPKDVPFEQEHEHHDHYETKPCNTRAAMWLQHLYLIKIIEV